MRSDPVFSIVIPSFNAEKTIGACLDSILRQSFRDFEIIVVDGLSKDRTGQILESYLARNKNLNLISESDEGIYDALNKGIDRAKGKWLLFLGSDDLLFNDAVLGNVFAELENQEAEMIYGNAKIVGKTPWAKDGDVYDGEFSWRKLFLQNICHQAVFYSKNLFSRIGKYNIDYEISADWDLNIRCFAYCRVKYTKLIISSFHAGGESTKKNNDLFTSRDIVLNLKQNFKTGYFNNLYKTYSWVFYNLAHHNLTRGAFRKSLYFLFFSVYHSSRKMGLLKNYTINFLKIKKLTA